MKEISYPPLTVLRICIDHAVKKEISGRAYCPLFPESVLFENQCELILKADRMFERAGYPQAFQQKRSFLTEEPATYNPAAEIFLTESELLQKVGAIATVNVIVECRRRAGWQGKYIDGMGRPHCFISEMELLNYMEKEKLPENR